VQVFAVDHGSPQLTGTTTVYVTVEGSQRPVFESRNYEFIVRDSQSIISHFALDFTVSC